MGLTTAVLANGGAVVPPAPPPAPPPASAPTAPPPIASELPLPGGAAQLPGVFVASTPTYAPAPSSSSAGAPSIASELPLPGGAAQLPGIFVASTPSTPSIASELPLPGGADQVPGVFVEPADGGAGGSSGGAGGALDDAPPWELIDPFDERSLAGRNPPLRGADWVAALLDYVGFLHIEAMAVGADALGEGASGRIGDHGLAYGPFQDHLTEFRGRPFYGRGKNNPIVNAWAWSRNGLEYSLRQMAAANPSARDKVGHAAVAAIVRGYEQPADIPGAIRVRTGYYDELAGKGKQWAAYLATQMVGPKGARGTIPKLPPGQAAAPSDSPKPTKSFKALLAFLAHDVPAAGARARASGVRSRNAVRSKLWTSHTG